MSVRTQFPLQETWETVGVTLEGYPLSIGPIENIWDERWISTGEPPVKLPHPRSPHIIVTYETYRVARGSQIVEFAATRLFMDSWGFYVKG